MIRSIEESPKVVQRMMKDRLKKLRRLTPHAMAKRRWRLVRSCVKLLGLQAKAVVTANHPDRMNFSVSDDLTS